MKGSKITFILGAGASAAYGYPVSSALRNEICREIGHKNKLFRDLKDYTGKSDADINIFREQFFYSNNSSIDLFLSQHPEHMEIGKAAIIFKLSQNESRGSLGEVEDNWFQYIAKNFIDYDHSVNSFKRDKIRFISFNYDRSLEELLYCYVRHSYYPWSLTDERNKEAVNLVKRIPIVHVYGRFDFLHWEKDGARVYGDQERLSGCYEGIASEIELMRNEEIGDSLGKRLKTATEYIGDSDFLVFLGFGFDLQNFNLLQVSNYFKGQNIYASGFGLLPAQQRSITHMFDPDTRHKFVMGESGHNCERFMKESIDYI